jgi:hypothetical protein
MPKEPIDYSKTIFYRIVCNDLNITDCYIGHTTNFIKRKQHHKDDCNNDKSKKYNMKVYKFIRDNGGWMNWSMIMIEQISCENLNDACKLERKFLEEYKATLNSYIPSRTNKEYYIDNIDKIKEYYIDNIDKIKEYRELNKDKRKEQQKEWIEKNKDKKKEYIKEYLKLTIFCNCCKKNIKKATKSRHLKSKNHIKNLI